MTTVSLSYLKQCLQIEAVSSILDINRIRELYERAVSNFGQTNEDMWIEYIQWEYLHDEGKKASTLFWKAKKTVSNPTSFITKYHQLNLQV